MKSGLTVIVLVALLLALARSAGAEISLDSAAVGAGPYYLDIAGETYVLTEDIETPGTALVFAANNVTLDLNQHTVTYGTIPNSYRYGVAVPPPYPHSAPRWSESDITVWENADGSTVKNGTIEQGAGEGADCASVIARSQDGITIQDLNISMIGDDTFAISINEFKNMTISGNTITDLTNVVTNRHAGRAAIDISSASDGNIEVFNNIIHNCRQWGIRVSRRNPATIWGRIHNNEIYANTIVTNGYGIGIRGDRMEAFGNTIQATNGRGIHISNCDGALVHDNDIDVVEINIPEYNKLSAHGIKLERCTNAEVYENYVVSRGLVVDGSNICNGSALNFTVNENSNNHVHDNIFVARHMGGDAFDPSNYGFHASAIEVVVVENNSGLRIVNNTFITNDRFFSSTEWNSADGSPLDGSSILIKGNTWTRETTTVPTRKYDLFFFYTSVTGLRFLDNNGGDFLNYGTGWPWSYNSWSVGNTGTIKTLDENGDPVSGVDVTVRNSQGEVAVTGSTDPTGKFMAALDEWVASAAGRSTEHVYTLTDLNPHEFTAEFVEGDQTVHATVEESGWITTLRPPLNGVPTAEFSGSPTSGDSPLTVEFSDLSSNDPTSWSWSFGDGGVSTDRNPSHTYNSPGLYTVSLVAANGVGSNTETKFDYINVSEPIVPPVAEFSGSPTSGVAPHAVNFTDLSSNNPTSWYWTFGDGGTSTAQSPSHTYNGAGTYEVALTTTNSGGSDTETKTDYISVSLPPAPEAEFSGTPTSGTTPLTVSFSDESANSPTSWSWTFGDGGTSSSQNPGHTYSDVGTFAVTLTATNATGSDTETKTDYISVSLPPAPDADFSGIPTSGTAPLTVTFSDQSANSPTSWSWTFGDGGTSSSQNPGHTYSDVGTFAVTLTATNATGSDTETKTDYITVSLPPAPEAEFSGTPTSGTSPLTVAFSDQSANSPTSWSWTFGDGGTSSSQNPDHTYSDSGTFAVTLTATNATGSDTETKIEYITVTPPPAPVAAFNANPTSGLAPHAVDFKDLSSNNPTSWSWSFGDGGTSASQNPSYTYDSAGTYEITLTATNAAGSDSETKTNYVTVSDPPAAPVADFSGSPTSGSNPLTVEFVDLSNNTPTSWSWSFGDGGTSSLQNPSHIYTTEGSFEVGLTVTNAGGSNVETKSSYITVTPQTNSTPPRANFYGTPTLGQSPLTVEFADLSEDDPSHWAWSFGDGTESSEKNPTHVYESAGLFTVALTSTNAAGSNTKTRTGYIIVTAPPQPVANFSADPTDGPAPLTVEFTDQSRNEPTSWLWTFGDGETSTDRHPTHTYEEPGAYDVVLIAASATGTDTVTRQAFITVSSTALPPVAAFVGNPRSGQAPLAVSFTDQSTNGPSTWFWTFGDGGNSTEQHPNHVYENAGSYHVRLTVTNDDGTSTMTIEDYVTVAVASAPPIAEFVGDPTSGSAPLTVGFVDQSVNEPTSWLWGFGDGNTSAEQSPNHTYESAGSYEVSLIATNADGTGTIRKVDYVTVTDAILLPVADFVGEPTLGTAPLTVEFTDQSTNAPTSWTWDFGDGVTSTDQNPDHDYETAGTYTVTLTTSNVSGSDTEAKLSYVVVTEPPPIASLSATPTSGEVPLIVQFRDTSENEGNAWLWSFGDGQSSSQRNPEHTYSEAGTYDVSLTISNQSGEDTDTKIAYITATAPDPVPDDVPPASISTLSGYALAVDALRLSWIAVGDDHQVGQAAEYDLRWSVNAITGDVWESLESLVDDVPIPGTSGSVQSFEMNGLVAGETYYFGLKVFDEAGNVSTLSNVAEVTLPVPQDTSPPSAPSAVTAEAGDEEVVVEWSASPDPDLASYVVYRRVATASQREVVAEGVTGTTYSDSTVEPGLRYGFSVTAVDNAGNSSTRSVEAWVDVPELEEPPLVHTVMFLQSHLDRASDWLTIEWSTEGSADLAGFLVYRERLGSGASETVAALGEWDLLAPSGPVEPVTQVVLPGPGPHVVRETPLPEPGTYRYWIEAIGISKNTQYLEPIQIVVPNADATFEVYPNPTSDRINVSFSLEEAASVRFAVYSASGRVVFEEDVAFLDSGRHTVQWDRISRNGTQVATGTYFVILQYGGSILKERIVIVRRAED